MVLGYYCDMALTSKVNRDLGSEGLMGVGPLGLRDLGFQGLKVLWPYAFRV